MKKFIFANQLRGLAALAVIISHWTGVYWVMRDTVAHYTSTPMLLSDSPLNPMIFGYHHWFNLGPFGVGLFFLISGFVIPLSLQTFSYTEFLKSRFFRVMPTYFAGLLLSLAVIWICGLYWDKSFPWNSKIVIANLLLSYNLFQDIPSIDLVNWTLAIEIKFYILVAFLVVPFKKGYVSPIFIFTIAVFIINWQLSELLSILDIELFDTALKSVSLDMMYIIFMLIGTLFCFYVQGKISVSVLTVSILFQLIFFGLTWKFSAQKDQFPFVTANYIYAFFIFVLSFSFREFFKPIYLVDLIAKISYPLYIIHSLIGFSVMQTLMHLNFSFYASVLIAAFIVSIIAYLIHIMVEVPTMLFGKRTVVPKRLSGFPGGIIRVSLDKKS